MGWERLLEPGMISTKEVLFFDGETLDGYKYCNGSKQRIFELLNNAGYYKLSVYNFIKTIADKRGAHIDTSIAPLIVLMNKQKYSIIECFAIQMIIQAQNQIKELADYDFPDVEL